MKKSENFLFNILNLHNCKLENVRLYKMSNYVVIDAEKKIFTNPIYYNNSKYFIRWFHKKIDTYSLITIIEEYLFEDDCTIQRELIEDLNASRYI